MMEIFEYTNKGCRDTNQDCVIHKLLSENSAVFVMADGMGGYAFGSDAAKIVATSIVDFVESNISRYVQPDLLKEAIRFANDNLMLRRLDVGGEMMGAVVAVLLVDGECAYITWLGDSRVYVFRGGNQIYCTEDHSFINELSVRHKMAIDPLIMRKYSSIVTRSIMGDNNLTEVPVAKVMIEFNDIFLLCSDGFHKAISLSSALKYKEGSRKELDELASSVSDNYSFIKVRM